MPRQLILVLAVLAALIGTGGDATASSRDGYIVVLRNGVDLQSTLEDQARLVAADVFQVYGHALNGYAARLTPANAAKLKKDSRVLYVFRDRPIELNAQEIPTGVRRVGAAGPRAMPSPLGASRGLGVGVAVLDTGIDLDHPDLGTVVPGANCVRRTMLPDDDNGHGTHVAGTVAARDNSFGVVGVAPEATLYAVKVMNAAGDGTWASLICGIDWVTANAAVIRVANMSLSSKFGSTPSDALCGNKNSDPLHTAICKSTLAGVTYVVSAGNDGADAGKYVPAAFDEVITVSALADSDGAPGGLGTSPACDSSQQDDSFASFSNFGSVVDLAAPGVCIDSTFAGGGYAVLSGTSMAAPHVAGAAVRYVGSHPTARPDEVRAVLIATAEPGPIAGDPDSSPEGVVRVGSVPTVVLPGLPPIPVPGPPTLPPVPALP